MPKIAKDLPKEIKDVISPYEFHGVRFEKYSGQENLKAERCPWCNGSRFFLNLNKGTWKCWSCGSGTDKGGGNSYTFIRKLHVASVVGTTEKDYTALRDHRKLLKTETLKIWGVCKSSITGEWLVPAFDAAGSMNNLYKYVKGPERYVLYPTPVHGAALFGVVLYGYAKPATKTVTTTRILEGPWDGMALFEIRPKTDTSDIICTPGCNVWKEPWNVLLKDTVVLMFDNDHPSTNKKTGQIMPPGGYTATRRLAKQLRKEQKRLQYLYWGPEGYDLNFKSGYDVRDFLTEE